ncbi:Gfo/Idh/MocA family oxidoreductase [Streptomyces hundungensis]|uniref:Gfo/Idh/MocA family protein n=1 Tax=Streptomyces hundungensis TaxID=1077946 RepID=UPI0033F53736
MSLHREPVPLVLAGARGHGRKHLDTIRRLALSGRVRLAGICELTPLSGAELDGFGAPEQSTDLTALLRSTGARVVVISTPIHTHTALALSAAEHGAHVLLEKPPAPSYAEFQRLADGIEPAGIAVQVGFQSLGSHAIGAIRDLVADGDIGDVLGIGAAGAWTRDEAYFRRAPWAGHRRLNGDDVVDGVLTNPLAHAVATALALDGSTGAGDIEAIETELFRAHDIEADDTSYVAVTTTSGRRIGVAATLCAEHPDEPYVVVHGSRGRVTFWYKQDRVLVQRSGHGPEESFHGRTDLLVNLLDHLEGRAALLVPLRATAAFMRVVEAVRGAPDPARLPTEAWMRVTDEEGSARRVVHGIDALVAVCADTLDGFGALGAPWAGAPREADAL